jgi:hypothetical protein
MATMIGAETAQGKDNMAQQRFSDLGNISLQSGYPRKETIASLYDELDYQRAVQVYLWALPAVSVQVAYENCRDAFGAGPTTVAIFEDFLDAKTIVATGNGQSIYSVSFADLQETGPLVVETPPAVLGFAMDLWQYPIVDIGVFGPDKGQGGRFLLLPPDYTGDVPEGYFVVPCDTNIVNIGLRGFVRDGKTESAVNVIKRSRAYPLAQKDNPPPMHFVNASGVAVTMLPIGDTLTTIAYFQVLARLVEHEAVREKDRAMLGMAASIGIEKGRPFAPDTRMQGILAQAAQVASVIAATQSFASRYPQRHTWPGKRWEEIFQTTEATLENPNYLELDAKTTLYYQAMGGSKQILLSIVGAGSKYSAAFQDRAGEWLEGSHDYRLRVPPDVPVKDFWSVTVYDAETRSMIANAQGRSGRDSYQTDLQINDDGSVDLYFGPTEPASHARNWVQTNPGTGFFVYFRWYGPLEPYFDKSWQLPDIERI